MRAILTALAVIAATSTCAFAQTAMPGLPLRALGYCQLSSIDTAAALSACAGGIPAGANFAVMQPEAQAIRYRDDGTAPTTAVGFPVAVGASIVRSGNLSNIRVISSTAGAKLNVLFYKSP